MAMYISQSELAPIVLRFLLVVGPEVKNILEELELELDEGTLAKEEIEALIASGIVEVQTHAAHAVQKLFGDNDGS